MFFSKDIIERYRFDAEGLADYFLGFYYRDSEKSFPVDPFAILKSLGVQYVFRNLDRLEGLLLAGSTESDVNLVVINSNSGIQRMRFSCAHELCHFLKDVGNPEYKPLRCLPGSKSRIERYAERFAASLLMPREEVKATIASHIKKCYLSTDDILAIADYFGVSFLSCYYRITQVSPEALPDDIEVQVKRFKPNKRRVELGFSDLVLYEQILDSWDGAWNDSFNSRASYVFKNEYVFNDSRLEGVDVTKEAIGEILTDLRMNTQASRYCSSGYIDLAEVAGHSELYDYIFCYPKQEKISIFTVVELNRILFSCVPYPEFGGRTRKQNTAVIGAKFETVDYSEVMPELIKLDEKVKILEEQNSMLRKTEIVRLIAYIHHRLTVIHPFEDGNGRTCRAFMNLLLMRYGIPPVFIELEKKKDYINALSIADANSDVEALYSILLKGTIKSHSNNYSFNVRS